MPVRMNTEWKITQSTACSPTNQPLLSFSSFSSSFSSQNLHHRFHQPKLYKGMEFYNTMAWTEITICTVANLSFNNQNNILVKCFWTNNTVCYFFAKFLLFALIRNEATLQIINHAKMFLLTYVPKSKYKNSRE